jgi:thymidylate synthase
MVTTKNANLLFTNYFGFSRRYQYKIPSRKWSKYGILGLIKWQPVYGHQWRNWNSEEIDQITDLITELKTNQIVVE